MILAGCFICTRLTTERIRRRALCVVGGHRPAGADVEHECLRRPWRLCPSCGTLVVNV